MRFLTPAMLTVLLLLVVAGLVVAYVVKNLFAVEPVAAPAPRNYPMAVADLEPGTVITAAHLAQGPYAGPPQKTFARADSILIGRVVREKIVAATPIDTTKLYPPGEYPPVEVAVGMRAVSLEVGSGAAIVDGLVRAGEYIDVHFTPSGYNDNRFRGGLTMTLFKGVKVLAVNRVRSVGAGRAGGFNTVTLELTPEQSNILLLAKGKGELNLTYTPDGPGNGGVALADDDRAFLEEILGLAPPPEPKKPFVTEHYRGAGRGVMAFNDDGTLWGGDFGGDSYGYGGYGTGTRPAPRQVGGHEPSGPGGWSGGYYRGIDAPSAPPGSHALPNAAPHGTPRLIPSPNNNASGATEGRTPAGFDGV